MSRDRAHSLPGCNGYQLPLSPGEFRAALQDGRGRAQVHAAEFGVDGHLLDVVNATLHNLAVDPQTEGGRGEWMVALLERAGALDQALPHLRGALGPGAMLVEGVARWDQSQRCGVLCALARRGHEWARGEILDLIAADREWTFGYPLGTAQLLELSGATGVVTLASILGEEAGELDLDTLAHLLSSDLDDDLIDQARESILAALGPHLATQAGARALLAAFESSDEGSAERVRRPSRTSPYPSEYAAQAIDWVETLTGDEVPPHGERPDRLRRWAMKAGPEALQLVAEAWVKAGTDLRRYAYAMAFRRGEVPFVDDRMIAMAESSSSDLAQAARQALRRTAHPKIRAAALRHIDAQGLLDGWHALLAMNYDASDAPKLEEAFQVLQRCPGDREGRHTVGRGILMLAKPDGRGELFGLLRAAYEMNPCGECREMLAGYLHDMGRLPRWIRDEVEMDAYVDAADLPWREPPTNVHGLRLPMAMCQLWKEGKWRSPSDGAVQEAIPGLQGPIEFLEEADWLLSENKDPMGNAPLRAQLREYDVGERPEQPDLPWRDRSRSVVIAVNRILGDDLAIALDFRTSTGNPRVIATFWQGDGTDHLVEWRCVAPTLTEFLANLGMLD